MNFKKLVVPIVLIMAVFTSCKNSLNIQAPYKDITVVYGLMDQNDPVHYIRINKAFEGNGNALTMAKQYDSIYYPVSAISAVLQDSNPNTGAIISNVTLGTTTSVPLPPGTFSYPKQLLYYTNETLNPNDYYNIIITNSKTGKTLRGSTYLLGDITLSLSHSKYLVLNSQPNLPTAISWTSTATAQIYQMTLLFYYDTQVGSNPAQLQAPLQLVLGQQTDPVSSGGSNMNYELTCQELFALILGTPSIHAQAGVTYHADSLGIIFTSGTYDLNTYIQLSQPPEGINQDVPSFSDVTNGVGLYTARHIQTYYRQIDLSTLDSLQGQQQEARFKNLGFSSN